MWRRFSTADMAPENLEAARSERKEADELEFAQDDTQDDAGDELQGGLAPFFLLGVLRTKPHSDTLNQISTGTGALLASGLEDTFEFPAGQRCRMSDGCLLRWRGRLVSLVRLRF